MQTTIRLIYNTYFTMSLWDLGLDVLGIHIVISQYLITG